MKNKIQNLQEMSFPLEAREHLTSEETRRVLAQRPEHQGSYPLAKNDSEPVRLNLYGEILNDQENYSANHLGRTSQRKYGQVEIYKSVPEDVKEIYGLGKNEPRFLGFWPQGCLEQAVKDENIFMYSARNQGELKGFALASYTPSLRKVSFENLYVSPDSRRIMYNGDTISGNLIDKILQESEKVGAVYVTAQLEQDNLAIQKRLKRDGFKFYGKELKGKPNNFFFGYKVLGDKHDSWEKDRFSRWSLRKQR